LQLNDKFVFIIFISLGLCGPLQISRACSRENSVVIATSILARPSASGGIMERSMSSKIDDVDLENGRSNSVLHK